jgi:acyl carrier protein
MENNKPGARTAVAVRRAVAGVGLVDPAFIFASDRFPDDLDVLPLWDSMDFLDLTLRLEKELDVEIPNRIAEGLFDIRGFTVRELAERVYANVPSAGHSEMHDL